MKRKDKAKVKVFRHFGTSRQLCPSGSQTPLNGDSLSIDAKLT